MSEEKNLNVSVAEKRPVWIKKTKSFGSCIRSRLQLFHQLIGFEFDEYVSSIVSSLGVNDVYIGEGDAIEEIVPSLEEARAVFVTVDRVGKIVMIELYCYTPLVVLGDSDIKDLQHFINGTHRNFNEMLSKREIPSLNNWKNR